MAVVIREQHRLPTLRLWLGAESRRDADDELDSAASRHAMGQVVRSQIYNGRDAASPVLQTPLKAIGLAEGPHPANVRSADLSATSIVGQVQALAASTPDGEPLWYHIGENAAKLAILPWETMFRVVVPDPFLRIPNFDAVPYRRKAVTRVVVCASAPAQDGPCDVLAYLGACLRAIAEGARSADAEIVVTVFLDPLCSSPASPTAPVEKVSIEFASFEPSRSKPNPTGRGNAWLDWIRTSLGGQPADIVHFIGLGFIEGERGALVLAGSPESGGAGSTVIGGWELVRFYDQVGCTAMVFSNPYDQRWVEGQRALAFELSWTRAGPIILADAPADKLDGLASVYGMLFGSGRTSFNAGLRAARPVHACVHPRLLEPSSGGPPLAAAASEDRTAALIRNQSALLEPSRGLTVSEAAEAVGSHTALDFLSSLVARRR